MTIAAKDGFTQMIDDSNAFFTELARNNTKDWFSPRKEHYTANIKKPAELFAEILAEDFSQISAAAHMPKLFHIYRDVRFSKDKTPLKAHLHILWSQSSDAPFAPAFFFGSDPSGISVGTGIMGLQGEALTRFRAFVDNWGDPLDEAIAASNLTPSEWGPPALKKVPKPYDHDHPHAAHLKRKSLIISGPLDPDWRSHKAGLTGAVKDAFRKAQAFRTLLDERLG